MTGFSNITVRTVGNTSKLIEFIAIWYKMMNIFGKKKKVSTPVERKEILDSLLNAAQYGNHELVLKILQQGSFIVNGTDENGKSSLHIACLNSHLKTAQVLTSFGADVNQSDENGWTPLHCATTSRNSELILHVLNNEEIKGNEQAIDMSNKNINSKCFKWRQQYTVTLFSKKSL